MTNTSILVTGGAGYIGCHTVLELLKTGHKVIVVDNLSNASRESLVRVEKLTGKSITFYEADIRNKEDLKKVFKSHPIDGVIHFAGLKAVGESVAQPLAYYDNNITGTIVLLEVMAEAKVKNIIFSSSASVYGDPDTLPISETAPLQPTNPYARSKMIIEDILQDLHTADQEWNITNLRYFNPLGAHESGLIGEDPEGIPNNLAPFIAQVAVGKLPSLKVYGDDYPTIDGTGVRDYIHVVDIAHGHVVALDELRKNSGVKTYNLGTGKGYSVFEVIKAFEKASGRKIPYEVVARRPGDIAECYADPTLAEKELDWKSERSLDDMMESIWKWQSKNPNGYRSR